MSDLINAKRAGRNFRWQLLSSVSAVTLIASSAGTLANDDTDRPTVWIELGGQLERVDAAQTVFAPPFFDKASPSVLAPMIDAQLSPRYSIGGEGKLTFVPQDSDWVFSASVRYGRSNATRHLHQQTAHPAVPMTVYGHTISSVALTLHEFGDGQSQLEASHAILDFQAGKDVGLGMFGAGSSSVLSAGVRFAQFASKSDVILRARPVYGSLPQFGVPGNHTFHSRFLSNNTAVIQATRSVQAIGPSASWEASVPVLGSDSSMTVAFGWGLNAAILFGRQRAHVHHQTTGAYFKGLFAASGGTADKLSSYTHGPYDHTRARTVTIPNVGGFAGISFKYLDAKLKFGYRADFFFGAIDGGVDTAKKENVGFYGPFATISVGIGG